MSFKTNKCHHGGPPWSGGPEAIATVALPLIRPCSPYYATERTQSRCFVALSYRKPSRRLTQTVKPKRRDRTSHADFALYYLSVYRVCQWLPNLFKPLRKSSLGVISDYVLLPLIFRSDRS